MTLWQNEVTLYNFTILYVSIRIYKRGDLTLSAWVFAKYQIIDHSSKSLVTVSSYLWPRTLQQLVQHTRARKDKHPLQLYNNKWTIADQHYDGICLERIYLVS